jgi:hypothetical protein
MKQTKRKGSDSAKVLTLINTKILNKHSNKGLPHKIAALIVEAMQLRNLNRKQLNIPQHLHSESDLLFSNVMQLLQKRLGGRSPWVN